MSNTKLQTASTFEVAVHTAGVAITTNAFAASKRRSAPTQVKGRDPKDGKVQGSVAAWGDSNAYPQDRKELIKKHSEFAPLLEKKAAFLMGLGVFPARLGVDQNGDPTYNIDIESPEGKEAWAFLSNRKFKRWFREAGIDFVYFRNIFPEVILEPTRKSVLRIAHQEASDCRLQLQTKLGQLTHCWINPHWESYKEDKTSRLPVIDARKTADVEEVRQQKGKYHYIYVSSYPSPGDGYYQTPSHEGYFLSKWYDIAMAIPEFKKAIMKNKMSIKYHIEIDKDYWAERYPGFYDKYDDKKRKEVVKKELKAIEETLTGADKAGVTLTTAMEWVKHKNEHRSMWKITPLKNNDKDGEHLEDSRESSMHLMRALNLDPAIVGMGPGRDNASAGSGSDKWAATKIYLPTLEPEREVLLDVVSFVFEYNGWAAKGLVPRIFDHSIFTTATASDLGKESTAGNPNPKRED